MRTSYHTHSNWSDGQTPIPDMVKTAGVLGLDEFGMSDHLVMHHTAQPLVWSMPPESLPEYVEAVQAAAGTASEGLIVRLGIEVDYFPEDEAEIREALASQPFDYVIGSVHFFDGFPIDEAAEHWDVLSQGERDDIIRGYWVRMRQMAESGLFDIAGHLDLTKKFGHRPSAEPLNEITSALDAIARSGMVVEINTAGWRKPSCKEQYPSSAILGACGERAIPIVVTADAHCPEDLTAGFDDAYALARRLGYHSMASFDARRRREWPIP